jgi:hypothetical protein
MRLSDHEIHCIVTAVERHFGPSVAVRLFGSRADPLARGGDIALYLDGVDATEPRVRRLRRLLLAELNERLGAQSIDVLVRRVGSPALPIHRIAVATGVELR